MDMNTFRELVYSIRDNNYAAVCRTYNALFDKWETGHKCRPSWDTRRPCSCHYTFQTFVLRDAMGQSTYSGFQAILYGVPNEAITAGSRTFISRRTVCQRWRMTAREVHERLPAISPSFWSTLARCAHKVTPKYAFEGIRRQVRRRTLAERERHQVPQPIPQPKDVTNFVDVLAGLQQADPRYGTLVYQVHDERCKALEQAELGIRSAAQRLEARHARLKRREDGLYSAVRQGWAPEHEERCRALYLVRLRLELQARQLHRRSVLLTQHRQEINSLFYERVPQPQIPEVRDLHDGQQEEERRLKDRQARQRDTVAGLREGCAQVTNMMQIDMEELQERLERRVAGILKRVDG